MVKDPMNAKKFSLSEIELVAEELGSVIVLMLAGCFFCSTEYTYIAYVLITGEYMSVGMISCLFYTHDQKSRMNGYQSRVAETTKKIFMRGHWKAQ